MHAFKTSGRQVAQCRCQWCGAHGNRGDCIAEDVKRAVAVFAADHGRTWKSKLRELWSSGKDSGALRTARNVIGPKRLDNVSPIMLKRFSPRAELFGRKLATLADAQQWFREMHAAGLLFHPDDDPESIVEARGGSRTFTASEVPAVRARMREVRAMNWIAWGGHAECPCGWIMSEIDPYGVKDAAPKTCCECGGELVEFAKIIGFMEGAPRQWDATREAAYVCDDCDRGHDVFGRGM